MPERQPERIVYVHAESPRARYARLSCGFFGCGFLFLLVGVALLALMFFIL